MFYTCQKHEKITFKGHITPHIDMSHLSDLGIVTQRDCASTTLHFLLLVVHMEWKILIEHIPNPASDKFKAYFFPNFGHICTKI